MMLERSTLLNNRYRIVEILGQGGMGSIYRALDENLGVEVAVKDNLFTTEDYARQFRREANILALLRHPNLPRVTDHFVITGQGQYLVMDYIEGEDLRQRMERIGTLPEEEVIPIGAAVCDALSYLHSLNPPVIHRDIKPGNIKITPQGHIFLVDFGLAKLLEGTQATTTGARAMTPGYSPAEQYGTARTDQRTDIYSLGATLYAALTGAIPEDALARAMDQTALIPVRKHNPRVSKRLAIVIEKAMEVRPDDRYQTAEEFKQALLAASSSTFSRQKTGEYFVTPPPLEEKPQLSDDDLLHKFEEKRSFSGEEIPPFTPISVSVTGAQNRPSRPASRRRRNVRWVLVGLIIIGLFYVLYLYNPGFPLRTLASYWPAISRYLPMSTQSADTSSTQAQAGTTLTPLAVSFLGTPTLTGQNTSTLMPSATSSLGAPILAPQTQTPTQTPAATFTPFPTPFGGGSGQIAYVSDYSGSEQIYLINSDGTGRRPVTDIPEGACQPAWSPDGMRVVFISPCEADTDYYPGAAMYVVNVDGTGLLPLPTVVGGDFDPAWSPDGKYIAFTSLRNSGHPQIFLLNLEDNSVKVISEKYALDSQPSWSPDGKQIVFINTRGGVSKVWIMDSDGNNRRLFSQNQTPYNYYPVFSPDGQTILFTQYLAQGSVPRVMFSPLDSEDYVEYQVGKTSLPMRYGHYSPDGLWISYEGWEVGGNHNIYIIAATGAGRYAVTDDARIEFDPVWRPAQ